MQQKISFFELDGTVIENDLGDLIFKQVYKHTHYPLEQLKSQGFPHQIAAEYQYALTSMEGMNLQQLIQISLKACEEVQLKSSTLDLLLELHSEGYQLHLISATHGVALIVFWEYLFENLSGLPNLFFSPFGIFGAQQMYYHPQENQLYQWKDVLKLWVKHNLSLDFGKSFQLTPLVPFPMTTFEGKGVWIDNLYPQGIDIAVGDSPNDEFMMKRAKQCIWV